MINKRINFYLSKNFRTGGNLYNYSVINALQKKNDLKAIPPIQYSGRGRTYLQLFKASFIDILHRNKICIYDQEYGSFKFLNIGKKVIYIFHHYDIKEHQNNKRKHKILFNNSIRLMKKSMKVITVSKYWQDLLTDKYKINNVETIYNALDMNDYLLKTDKKDFYKKNNLEDKPIIYIGKNSIAKTQFTYEKIKFLSPKFNIITTGKIKEFDGPINLELSFQEYVNLLFLSKITILLTNFAEGWNRIAHESLICDTPVIGLKGSGGMEELLTMSGQKILDKESLSNIENIINSTINHIDIDKKIIEKLNIDYFNKEWENIVDSIL